MARSLEALHYEFRAAKAVWREHLRRFELEGEGSIEEHAARAAAGVRVVNAMIALSLETARRRGTEPRRPSKPPNRAPTQARQETDADTLQRDGRPPPAP